MEMATSLEVHSISPSDSLGLEAFSRIKAEEGEKGMFMKFEEYK
jgi:hypothetical protein